MGGITEVIHVIIVDDQQIVREGLKLILSLYKDDINVVGEASNGKGLLEYLAANKQPEVILMDIKMPVMDGIEATKQVKEKYPHIKIIILTTFNDNEFIFSGLKNGADGYILKDSDAEDILAAIKTACQGNILLNPNITTKVVRALIEAEDHKQVQSQFNQDETLLELLTPREMEVAKYVMEGKSNKMISHELFITEGTVKNYVSKILEKLNLKNRSELIVFFSF